MLPPFPPLFHPLVAPHVGAWIEIIGKKLKIDLWFVAPHVGAWIEISVQYPANPTSPVAPHVGAWIEITELTASMCAVVSLPMWGRGLKFPQLLMHERELCCRSPCGGVD